MNDALSTPVASPHSTELLMETSLVFPEGLPPLPLQARAPINGEMPVEGLNKSRPAPDKL